MKKLCTLAVCVVMIMMFEGSASAQAFRKGSLLVSVSEGETYSRYTTANTNGPTTDVLYHERINGDRDPLTVEYGLSSRWGIGLNVGTDIFKVDPSKFYGFETGKGYVKALMSEFTVDGNYHFYVRKKLDVAAVVSVGISSVSFKGSDGDYNYKYNSCGLIARAGVKVHYYFFRRLGAMGMLSAFATRCSDKDVQGNTAGQGYTTTIRGTTLEFGLCYRILK